MALAETTLLDVPTESLRYGYERFRLIRPREYTAMQESLRTWGQISAMIVGRCADNPQRFEVIDGFKRYRAAVALEKRTMKVRILDGGVHTLKAAIITLNRSQGGLHLFEEALVVHSLYRDDVLNQEQIAALFGRHKSWACRRIAVCQRLCDEAIENIRLGLLGFASARELCRLPQGNQIKALDCIQKHRLNSHETAQLVSSLLQSPPWEQDCILRLPVDILDHRCPPKSSTVHALYHRLLEGLEKLCGNIEAAVMSQDDAVIPGTQRDRLTTAIGKTIPLLGRLNESLQQDTHGY